MNKEQIKKQISDFLKEKEEIILAYIFGSFVQNENFHDVDIAVYLRKEFDKNNFKIFPYGYESGLISDLTSLIRRNVDFVVMNNADITLQQRIINKGSLLFSKDEKFRISYENYIRKLYIDAENLRRIKQYYLIKKINNA
ncbi:MAG: nucleotidyltransferase domain-containing protein [Ignavibacteriaceae bacterium]